MHHSRLGFRKGQTLLQAVEVACVLLGLIAMSGALGIILVERQDLAAPNMAGASGLYWGVLLVAYSLTAGFAVLRPHRFLNRVLANPIVVILCVLASVSVLWSANPEVTVRRALALWGTTLFGVYLSARFDGLRSLRLLVVGLTVAAAISVAVAILVPELGIHQGLHAGDWRGSFIHKNNFGRVMALAAAFAFILAMHDRTTKKFAWPIFFFFVALVGLSGSRTAWVVLPFLLTVYLAARVLTLPVRIAIPAALGVLALSVGAVAGVVVMRDVLLAALGRDLTLTGRTLLWHAAFETGLMRPWIGYGYGAYWLGSEGGAALISDRVWGVDTGHGHNSFLDVWLELGLVGLLTVLVLIVSVAWHTVRRLRREGDVVGIWAAVLLAYVVATGFVAPALLERNSVFWVALVVAAYLVRAVPEPADPKRHGLFFSNKVMHLPWGGTRA